MIRADIFENSQLVRTEIIERIDAQTVRFRGLDSQGAEIESRDADPLEIESLQVREQETVRRDAIDRLRRLENNPIVSDLLIVLGVNENDVA